MGVGKFARDQLGRWVSYLACVDRPVPALILAAPEQSLPIRPHLFSHTGSRGIGSPKATDKRGVYRPATNEMNNQCNQCKRHFKNQRGVSVHQRYCRKSTMHAESTEHCSKSSQLSSDRVEHHITSTDAGKLFRHKHLQPDERTADINNIKPKLKLPPANDEATWKEIDEDISNAFDSFKILSDAGKTLERRENFIYRYLEERFGTMPPRQTRKES